MSEIKRRFVLIVDDQAVVADTLALILRQSKYLAVGCYTAADALTISRAIVPQVLLCDVVLGSVSGIEVALAIRSMVPECKIFLMSGNTATPELIERARSAGMNFPLLTKPIALRELLATLEAANNAQAAIP